MNRAIKHTAGRAAAAVLPVVTVLILGQLATYPNLTPWYASLAKPSFNPPNWIFGPVWSTLYVLMIIAAWRVLRLPDVTSGRRLALTLFFSLFEVVALTLAVFSATLVSVDGESNWLEGAQLLAVYVVVALGFYYTGVVAPAG